MDLHVQRHLVHPVVVERAEVAQVEVEAEAAAVVQAVLNVRRQMAQLKILVLACVEQNYVVRVKENFVNHH